MVENIKVSVIVPAYNCERYLDDLFGCLLNQTLKDIEIIIVDNASCDKTAEKVNGYAQTDPRIRLLSQPSPGAGLARNTGIENARGKYAAFLDADDLYDETMLEKLWLRMEKSGADMGICSVCKIDYSKNTESCSSAFSADENISEDKVFCFKDFKNVFSAFDVSPQNKMFRLGFIEENSLRFSSTRSSNDLFFTQAARISAEKIVFVTEDLVTIRRNLNFDSLSTTRVKSSEDIVTVLRELYAYLEEKGLSEELKDKFTDFSCKHIKYGAQGGTNEKFYIAVKKWLREEPWTCVSKESFYKKMNFCFFHSELVKKRLRSEAEAASTEEDRAVIMRRLCERENLEKAMTVFIDAFFDGDTALAEKCEAEQIKTEFEKAYGKSMRYYDERNKKHVLAEKNKKLKEDLNKIKNSFSFRLGRFLTAIPRKIRSIFKK